MCAYRAKAEIFGLSGITAEIDSELKIQHGIYMDSPNDILGRNINDLTRAYCGMQDLNENKFKQNFKNIARSSLELDGYGQWIPPD